MEKSKELELDVQYLKDVYIKSMHLYDNLILKLKNNRNLISKRKEFIYSQFKIIFGSGRFL